MLRFADTLGLPVVFNSFKKLYLSGTLSATKIGINMNHYNCLLIIKRVQGSFSHVVFRTVEDGWGDFMLARFG